MTTESIPPIVEETASEKIIMVTLEQTLRTTHNWAIDRIHSICDRDIDNAHAIQSEFSEWLNPNIDNHDIFSLEYIGDKK